jgi:predicted nucleic acid-binding protein
VSSVIQSQRVLRLFLDSNVLTGGIVARWGLDRAVLSLCAARICRMVLAEAVRQEVEENLLLHAAELQSEEAETLLDDYTTLIRLARPEIVPYPAASEVLASRRLIAHEADVPVLLSAVHSQPDWLLTRNRKHFTPQVAKRTKLQIGSPADFFRLLSQGIG